MRKKHAAFLSPAVVLEQSEHTIAAASSPKSLLIQTTTEEPTDAGKIQNDTVKQPWTPFVLRKWVLITFAIALLLMVAGLEMVKKICDAKHGFGPIDNNLHYVWTYGPTAVFTLAAAFWTQVDYRTRLLQPWEELARRTRPARANLLLDHISRHPVLSFYSALRFRHWPVATVLFASLALKALVVVSTGLFALQVVNEPISIPVVLTAQIQERDFDPLSVDFTAVSIYKSNLLDGSSYPQGTNAEYVVETFNAAEAIQTNSFNLSATIKSFTAGLDCVPATLEGNIRLSDSTNDGKTGKVYLTAANHDCRISDFKADGMNTGTYHDKWFGFSALEKCDTDKEDQERERLVITWLSADRDLYMEEDSEPNLKNSTTLFCTPYFSIQQDEATIDETGAIIQVVRGESSQNSHPTTNSMIVQGVLQSVFSDDQIGTTHGYNSSIFNSDRLGELIIASQDAVTVDDLSNFDLLAKGANEVYRGIAVQLAKQYLLVANETESRRDLEGVARYEHQRLFVRNIFLRIVETILCILALLSISLAVRSRKRLPPRDVASIARVSAAVSKSKDLMDVLSETGLWPCRELKRLLQSTYSARYKLIEDDTRAEHRDFVIEGHRTTEGRVNDSKEEYWRPLMISWYVRVALLVMPLAIIVTLEVLLRLSHRDSGICDIIQNKQTQLAASIVPAFVMASTKLLYSGYDFNLRIFDPYVQLHKRSATANSSILNKTIYTWKTDAFWNALIRKRYAVGASTLSVTIAAFLTIAASGLFTPTPISRNASIEVTRGDQFFYSDTGSIYNNYSVSMLRKARLVGYGEMGNSNWTYGQYAVPTMAVSSTELNALNTTSIDFQVPVHRGSLNCTLVPSEQVTINYTSSDSAFIRWPDLVGCTLIKSETPDGMQEIQFLDDMTNGPFGKWSPVDLANVVQEGCPASWGMYGAWANASIVELNIVQCWSSVQELQASVRLSMPAQQIVSLVADESTRKDIVTGAFTYLPLEFIFPKEYLEPISGPFSAFLRSETPDVLNLQLLERGNFAGLKERIQKVYSLAATDLLSSLDRNTTMVGVDPVIKATATYSIIRLLQNDVSTRILQGLLACMVICAVVSLSTVRLSKILPKNPCSIAAQASLVAGSEMMSRLPPEAQWMDDKEFNALFKGERYAMGWGVGSDGKERFGIDVDKSQSKESGSL